MENQVGHMPRGKSVSQIPAELSGLTKVFTDVNWGSSQQIKPRLSAYTVKCRLVQNNSGGALTPGQSVKWKSGAWGTQIGAVTGSLEQPCGIVDEYLPSAGVANGDYFWLVEEGPCKTVTNGAGTYSEQDHLVTAASGKTVKQTAAPTQGNELPQILAFVGIAMESAAATDGLLVRTYVKRFQP